MAKQGIVSRVGKILLLLTGVFAFPAFVQAQAVSSVEYRDFVITVDGKDSGFSQMSITTQDDGMTVMAGKASVIVNKFLLGKITYEIQATEWWKNGALVGFKAQVNDRGKKLDLQAAMSGDNLRLRTGVTDRILPHDIWVNSFWKLADVRFHNKQVPILDSDTGREFSGLLQYVAEEKINVSNQPLKCYHFRVTGGPTTEELWFDEYYRLVRREFEEQRTKIVIQLANVRR